MIDAGRRYRITSVSADGVTSSITIAAADEAAAIEKSGIPKGRVVRVKQDQLAGAVEGFKESLGKVPLQLQSTFLSNLSSLLLGGMDSSSAFDKEVARYPAFKSKIPELSRFTLVSEKLAYLKFDRFLVLMAQVGEKSRRLGEVVGSATDDLLAREAMLSESRNKLMGAGVLVLVSSAAVLGLPQVMYEPLEKFKNARGLNFPENFWNRCIGHIYNATHNDLPFILGGIGLVVVFRKQLWAHLRGYWPLKPIYLQGKARAGLEFVASFQPLVEAGIQDMEAITFMLKGAKGDLKVAYADILDNMQRGVALSDAFTHPIWPDLLVNGMGGYSNAKAEDRVKIFRRLRQLLSKDMINHANKTANVAKGLGMGLALFTVGMQVAGLMLPMMKVRAK